MTRTAISFVILSMLAMSAFGQAPPGAQGRKIGDFANVPEPPATTVIRCGTLVDGTGKQARRNVTIVLAADRVKELSESGVTILADQAH